MVLPARRGRPAEPKPARILPRNPIHGALSTVKNTQTCDTIQHLDTSARILFGLSDRKHLGSVVGVVEHRLPPRLAVLCAPHADDVEQPAVGTSVPR